MMSKINRILVILLGVMCVMGFFTAKTMVSAAESREQAEKEFYHEMEMEYLKETRKILSESGYLGSGVNLTKIIDEEGRRTYSVKIHNRRINALNDTEKEELLNALRSVSFADGQSEFHHEFITAGE